MFKQAQILEDYIKETIFSSRSLAKISPLGMGFNETLKLFL